MDARFFSVKDNRVDCELCPNFCKIAEGKTGICNVRLNSGGVLTLPYYGKLSALAMDPIEKKPLYHFYPGSQILSVGFVGCSLRCPFCQNYSISQSTGRTASYTSPEQLVDTAVREKSAGIAYTYSEPTIHIEYVLDTSKRAREKGLKNVLVTNGYLNPEPAGELLPYLDAANVDLKCFAEPFYRKEIKGKLEPVLEFIRMAAETIHLEVTTLVIPGKNDSDEEIYGIAEFLADLSPDIPYHLSCYYPTYRYSIPRTQSRLVEHLAEVASRKLNYVYLGNAGMHETNTYCPACSSLLIRRSGYSTEVAGIENGRCSACGSPVPVVR